MEDVLPRGTFFAEIPQENVRGMVYAIQKGLEIKAKFTWVADAFRKGSSISKIARKLKSEGLIEGANRTVMQAVTYSLKGYDGSIELAGTPGYDGLIEEEEYNGLWRKHNSQSSVSWNQEMQSRGIGLAGMTLEERQNSGRKGARTQLEGKIGIHGQTFKDHREVGRLGALAQGKTPWTDEEIKFCYELSQKDKEFLTPT